MRPLALITGLLLVTALVSIVPTAEAWNGCVTVAGTQTCVGDSCQFRSDCCPTTGLWCPESPPDS